MDAHHRWRMIWLILVLRTLSVPIISADEFAGGDGTASSPYQIASPEHLVALSSDPNLLDKHFVLIRDLDFVNVEPNAVHPVGHCEGKAFVGVFDGQGHAIAHLRIVRPDQPWVGLFGRIGEGLIGSPKYAEGHVRNVRLIDIHIHGADDVGGLAGELSAGTVRNCSVTGTIAGREMVGGLVGIVWTGGGIDSCTATVDVRGVSHVGGLIGDLGMVPSVSRCGSSGRVSGEDRVGGLIGLWSPHIFTGGIRESSASREQSGTARITQCRSNCSVYGTEDVGGLIGLNYGIGQIEDCYALGPVNGSARVGGLLGLRKGCCIVRCFSAGRVTGIKDVGGFIGRSEPVEDANGLGEYPSCRKVVEQVQEPNAPAGRAAGWTRWRLVYRPALLACFWDQEGSGATRPQGFGSDCEGVTPLVTDQVPQLATFRSQGWDCENTWTVGPDNPYPRLRWEDDPFVHHHQAN